MILVVCVDEGWTGVQPVDCCTTWKLQDRFSQTADRPSARQLWQLQSGPQVQINHVNVVDLLVLRYGWFFSRWVVWVGNMWLALCLVWAPTAVCLFVCCISCCHTGLFFLILFIFFTFIPQTIVTQCKRSKVSFTWTEELNCEQY